MSNPIETEDAPPIIQLRPHKILSSDLTSEQDRQAVEIVDAALTQFTNDKDVAANLKEQFESKYSGGSWQVILGSSYGCSLTHKTKGVLQFQITHKSSIMTVLLSQSPA
mmetsp:Transcript_61685/g.72081  ORF Transcript_61685/g.72081 Transcript_61685/m.72081 type:complete len:109 (+) Transcript_61685:211-537(+)|eukprot:CAMPEP_0194373904 /NCGR_PEP_ID=MMETSP0174-20130528/22297_1 /TAXON_ID=216777 /ORGANISM="Proboscia alata, Strain PI-D3" /LENGTH=108 /DNA_ID=CAMNT_0039153187 /DNA_START=161 /DNA_END=487 /DNA_ORIENTATION=+